VLYPNRITQARSLTVLLAKSNTTATPSFKSSFAGSVVLVRGDDSDAALKGVLADLKGTIDELKLLWLPCGSDDVQDRIRGVRGRWRPASTLRG
jgi:hypothetical protein